MTIPTRDTDTGCSATVHGCRFYSSITFLDFFQDDYDIKLEIARVQSFNASVYKYLKADFVLYNRTERVLNASWEQIVDLGSDIMLEVQLYKFVSNEYRFFPVFVTVNPCSEFSRNTFGAKTIFSKTSNIDPCNMKKSIYHVRNAVPDSSKFPPHLPHGKYEILCTFTYYSYELSVIEFYVEFIDKPVDWRKIPKRNRH
ncbi:hypothetical protein ILUMI_08575 [Ignelater luminosus]|uniref:Uncharacterized protein n=1 Tax=Ignelater luminosus TaxID=2038154 RepID=A0A8K0D607_IGNLU|nr:hypothetical protein ILUMI_08575 [Ignelater luminosus]